MNCRTLSFVPLLNPANTRDDVNKFTPSAYINIIDPI